MEDPSLLHARTGDVARTLARSLKLPVPDVAQRVRYGGGILARDLSAEDAARAVTDLAEKGVTAFVVPGADAPALPRTRRLAGFALGAAGLTGSLRGSTRREDLPWTRIRAIHVNALARELTPEEADEGRPTRPLPDVERVPEEILTLTAEIDLWEDRERRRVELCIDVIADEPLVVARITGEDADYASLPGKADSALMNFIVLARSLVAAAPSSVVVPPSTRRFTESLDWKSVVFDKPEQRDSWNLWLVLAVRHGRPFGAAVGEPRARREEKETARVVGDDEDSSDAEDLPDEATDDEFEDAASNLDASAKVTGDSEVVQALGHFDKTRKLRKSDVAELVAAAQEMADESVETDETAPQTVEAELQFFEEKRTGRWDAGEILRDSETLDDADVADEENDKGA
jgi:hypothetical protein